MGKQIMGQFMQESLRNFNAGKKSFMFSCGMGNSVHADIIPLCGDVWAVCIENFGALCNIHGNGGKPVAILC